MYTVDAKTFRKLVFKAIANRKKPLKCVTALQYASQLRNFNAFLEQRHPLDIGEREVEEYVRGISSEWARRRAVSAVGLLYRSLGRKSVADKLATTGFSRPDRKHVVDIGEQLCLDGWSLAALARLRWCDIRNMLLVSLRTQKSPPLNEPARSSLRRLLCKRYPRSSRLLGDGVTARVFTVNDLANLAERRGHRGRKHR